MNKRLGVRLTALIGSLILVGGTAISFGSIMLSYWLTVVTFGLCFGMGMGIIYTVPLTLAMKWFPNRKGLVLGLVLSGLGLSSFIIIPLQTGFINPNNLVSDYRPESSSDFFYFSQAEILDRVPYSFLLLGVIFLMFQLTGIVVMVEPESIAAANEERSRIKSKFLSILFYPWLVLRPRRREFPFLAKKVENDTDELEMLTLPNVQQDNESHHECSRIHSEKYSCDKLANDKDSEAEAIFHHTERHLYKVVQIKPIELIRRWDFYVIWFAFACVGDPVTYITSIYKVFGQGFIFDDHFLALVGSAGSVANCLARILWGFAADKVPCKVVLIVLYAGLSSLTYTFFGTSVMGQAGFFFWVVGFYFFLGGVFSVTPACTAEWYGSEHVGTNYGLLFLSQILSGTAAILLSTFAHHVLSWSNQMFIAGSVSFLGLILLIIGGGRRKLVRVH